jgi:predicted acyl esterase
MAEPCGASERNDSYLMLAWIAEQPWCNGITGMWGISYSGSSSLSAASLQPPSLKAIVPMHGTANEFWGFLRPHGCRPAWWTDASWGPWMVLLSLLPPLARDPERRWARVWHDRLETLEPVPFSWHTVPYNDYFAQLTDASKVEAAMYAVSGWHDYYPQATFDYFQAAKGPKKILIGSWKHEFPDLAVRGSIDFLTEMDRWWDRWLRGIENGIDTEPPIEIHHQGEDAWRTETAWPPARSTVQTFWTRADGSLSTESPDGPSDTVYTVDPTSGLDLLPWDPQAPVTPMPYDRSGDDHRGLVFDTAPFVEAI